MERALEVKLAWQTVHQLRTCPPESLLKTEDGKIHLMACPSCRETFNMPAEEKAGWEKLMSLMKSGIEQPATPQAVEAGQVWSVTREFAGWVGRGKWRNTAPVLVIGVDGNLVRVAQVCFETALAGQKDVVIEEAGLFVECWNVYSLHKKHLELFLDQISSSRLQEVIETTKMAAVDSEEFSIEYFFRTLEIQVAGNVSMAALPDVMGEVERG